MKVWLYYRLSRDEDKELNSLSNQRNIIHHYAVTNGHEVVGESFDDNVSGMHFNREGIDKIYEVVEAGKIEAIIVKDLSRLGRHRTQTALFIDYLREHDVRVLSATENIDTFNENDDLIIGSRGWSTTSMPATAAVVCGSVTGKSKRRASRPSHLSATSRIRTQKRSLS